MTASLDIWLVTIGEPLPIEANSRPLRTRLLARELAARGHRVCWWTSDFDHFGKKHHDLPSAQFATDEGYGLRFLHGREYKRNLSVSRQLNHVEIAQDFKRQAGDLAVPDVIVCSFPSIELAHEVSRYARKHDVRFAIDVRDLWPDEIFRRFPRGLQWIGYLLTLPLANMVSQTLKHSDATFAVSQQYFDWALRHAGRGPANHDRVIPLGYPDHPEAQAMRAGRSRHVDGEKCTFFFSGSFNQSVDLENFILAFRRLSGAGLRAVLCGDGENLPRWRELAARDDRILFPGWCTSDQIREYAQGADVGLVCYRRESLVAMPNKLFEYMSFGLPLVNSIVGEAATLVEGNRIGVNYSAGDTDSLTRVLEQMAASSTLRAELGMAAGKLFEERYRAARVIECYAEYLEALATGDRLAA